MNIEQFHLCFIDVSGCLQEEYGEEDEGDELERYDEHDGPPEGDRVEQDSADRWT